MPSTSSLGDDEFVVIESDRTASGVGDIVLKTGGVERARINADGTGTGWANVLGGAISAASTVIISSGSAGAAGDIVISQQGAEVGRWHSGKLGIGLGGAVPTWMLQVKPSGSSNGIYINAPEQSGGTLDSMNIWHRSAGDGIFIPHLGGAQSGATFTADTATGSSILSNVSSFSGLPVGTKITGTGIPAGATIASAPNTPAANQITISAPATATNATTTITQTASGAVGANGALNVLVPLYLDYNDGNGWAGTILNNRTGQRGITIQTETVNDARSINVVHWSNEYAAYFQIQQGGSPTGSPSKGTGGGIRVMDDGTSNSLFIKKTTAPSGSTDTSFTNGVVTIVASAAGTYGVFTVRDGSNNIKWSVDSLGHGIAQTLSIGNASPSTTNLLQAVVGGSVIGGLLVDGTLFTAKAAAPNSANLNAGQCAFWFDPVGKTLNAKAKDSGGTAVSAVIATLA